MGLSLGNMAREAGRLIPAAALRQLGQPAALFFHGVENQPGDPRLQTNHHTAETFRIIVRNLSRDFDIKPLTEIDTVLARPGAFARTVFLMSDDGYANTLAVAANILEGLPWSLFVSTRHIDSGRPNPVFLARLFFFHAPQGRIFRSVFLPEDLPGRCAEPRDGCVVRHRTAALSARRTGGKKPTLRWPWHFAPGQLDSLVGRHASERFLDWEGVRPALKARGVEIGAHADTHWPMHDGQSAAWLERQTHGARARIEAEVGSLPVLQLTPLATSAMSVPRPGPR